jgi:hypothetical protein
MMKASSSLRLLLLLAVVAIVESLKQRREREIFIVRVLLLGAEIKETVIRSINSVAIFFLFVLNEFRRSQSFVSV